MHSNTALASQIELNVANSNGSGKRAAAKNDPAVLTFDVSDDGVFANTENGRVHLSSRLDIAGVTRNENSEEWGRVLDFKDPDGKPHRFVMPMSLLAGDSTLLQAHLLALGLEVSPTRKARELLLSYIQKFEVETRFLCTSRVGWNNEWFVLPDETFGPGEGNTIFQSANFRGRKFQTRGSLESWQTQISEYCVGNSALTFAVAAAFAAPLLSVVGMQGGGFHYRGATSTGKTTALSTAGSVYGGSSSDPLGFCESWKATANGLEAIAEIHNNLLLCLDEIGQCDSRSVGEVAYMLSNGQGKSRMTKMVQARKALTWNLLFLSTGEQSLTDKMLEAGIRIKGGQDIRLCDINTDGQAHGLFENLHEFLSGRQLSDHLQQATKKHYGIAGREYLRWLTRQDLGEVRDRWAIFHEDFIKAVLPSLRSYPPEVARVASRFALVAFAGELATEAGVTGWIENGEGPGAATIAADAVFATWLGGREGSGGQTDAENALRQVRAFIEAHGNSRFQSLNETGFSNEKIINRVGFKRKTDGETQYLIMPESFRNEVCKGFDFKFVVATLASRDLLITDKGKNQKTERLPEIGVHKVYVLSSKLFNSQAMETPDGCYPEEDR